jgi:hypothetical protein
LQDVRIARAEDQWGFTGEGEDDFRDPANATEFVERIKARVTLERELKTVIRIARARQRRSTETAEAYDARMASLDEEEKVVSRYQTSCVRIYSSAFLFYSIFHFTALLR